MSIASEITRLQTAKADLKESLEYKGAVVPSEDTIDAYPQILDDIPTAILQDKEVNVGSGTTIIEADDGYTGLHEVTVNVAGNVEEKLVNFIDYEGTIVASYTGEEAQALSALPNAPDHSQDEVPLTFDEWNWTLAQIKTYNTSYPESKIWIGANYHTTDGKAHFYFNISSNNVLVRVILSQHSPTSNDTVDWGDGSAIEIISSDFISHYYSSVGEYHCVVTSNVASSYKFGGTSSSDIPYSVLLSRAYFPITVTKLTAYNFTLCTLLYSVSLPSSITSIERASFQNCNNLKSITIPKGVTTLYSNLFDGDSSIHSIAIPYTISGFDTYLFRYCYNLKSIVIYGITEIYSDYFSGCHNLQSITIPNGVTSIGISAFYNCHNLQSITLPNSITNIASQAFSSCYSLKSVIILATTPPTLANTSVFSLSYQQKIYVPAESVEVYKTATNWSTFASIIEAIPS